MQISTSQFYDRNASAMSALNVKTSTLNTQIASGKKIQAPSDDAPAYQTLAGLARDTADAKAYAGNVTMATSLLQQTDTTLASIQTQLQQASQLAIQANSGTLTAEAKTAIGVQLAGIADTLVGLANAKDPRGQPLLGGADGGDAVTKNVDGTYSFAATAPSAIPIDDDQTVQASETAARVFQSGGTDALSVISTLAAQLQSGGGGGASTSSAVTALGAAIDHLSGVQGSVGARAARVDLVKTDQTSAATDREAVRSGLEDTDATTAYIDLQKQTTILQATQASFTKLSSLSLFDYLK